MNVTREVIRDLLPLYAAGEASADTRALVEAFLRGDPELARLAEALRAGEAAPEAAPPPSSGRDELRRTQSLLRRRGWLLAWALFFTGLPLTFVADSGGIRFVLLREAPAVASISLAVAVALWVWFGVTARRLRVSGF